MGLQLSYENLDQPCKINENRGFGCLISTLNLSNLKALLSKIPLNLSNFQPNVSNDIGVLTCYSVDVEFYEQAAISLRGGGFSFPPINERSWGYPKNPISSKNSKHGGGSCLCGSFLFYAP